DDRGTDGHQPLGAARRVRFRLRGPQHAVERADRFTRAVGIRLAVLAGSHLQDNDLDQSLAVGTRALKVLRTVSSTRAHGYLRDFTTTLEPWKNAPAVSEFVDRARIELVAAV
ncbi:sporulation protein, partial [Streptomyces sp. NPDC056534]